MSERTYELCKEGHVTVRRDGIIIKTIPFPTTFDLTNDFQNFIDTYEAWRLRVGLDGTIDNVYEILAAMSDKLGRICRYVKHQERNDPKPDWPEGMTTEMTGLLAYMILLKNHYNVDLVKGMGLEFDKAVEQHGK